MIPRLWRGEISLFWTFWLFGAGGGLLIGLPLFSTLLALTEPPENTTATAFLGGLSVFLIYLVWVGVGIWRAANNYRGNPLWAMMAKGAVAAGVAFIFLLVRGVLFADVH